MYNDNYYNVLTFVSISIVIQYIIVMYHHLLVRSCNNIFRLHAEKSADADSESDICQLI